MIRIKVITNRKQLKNILEYLHHKQLKKWILTWTCREAIKLVHSQIIKEALVQRKTYKYKSTHAAHVVPNFYNPMA